MMLESQAEVPTKIVTASTEIPVKYRMIRKEREWRIYDVVIEGASLVNNYRSQFSQLLLNKTPEKVLAMLREKVKDV